MVAIARFLRGNREFSVLVMVMCSAQKQILLCFCGCVSAERGSIGLFMIGFASLYADDVSR